jgi:hypothetical protein
MSRPIIYVAEVNLKYSAQFEPFLHATKRSITPEEPVPATGYSQNHPIKHGNLPRGKLHIPRNTRTDIAIFHFSNLYTHTSCVPSLYGCNIWFIDLCKEHNVKLFEIKLNSSLSVNL